MKNKHAEPWQIWVDTGGTFTDCIAISPNGDQKTVKVLSSSALRGRITAQLSDSTFKIEQQWNAPDDFIRDFRLTTLDASDKQVIVTGFDRQQSTITVDNSLQIDSFPASFEVQSDEEAPVLAARLATRTPRNQVLPPINLRLATTKATNALLEKKGAPTALFITDGFEDLLEIGNQQRPDLFAMEVKKRRPVYDSVTSVPERLDAVGNVLQKLDCSELESTVEQLLNQGVTTAAVSLLHSYKNSDHERKLKHWLLQKGFEHVSVSSELSSFIGILSRAETTLVNAYLSPVVQQYLDNVQSVIPNEQMYVMTSAGGLNPKEQYAPKDSLLSGPAGGVVGAASAGKAAGQEQIISFDMGGTSSDVARYDSDFEYQFEHEVGNAKLTAPTLNIETVAAGGGSICHFDGHKLCVGPESAGAFPGAACYGAGGPLTITDVNLLLGRLDPQNFEIPVDLEAAEQELQNILRQVNASSSESLSMSKQEVLSGFLNIANERMTDAIRKISVQKGYDPREYALVAFGGAGGQHACAMASGLNISTVFIPQDAGLLSARGLGSAKVEEFAETQVLELLQEVESELNGFCNKLAQQARQKLADQGIKQEQITVRRRIISMRLEGQQTSLDIEYNETENPKETFQRAYRERYGHWISGRAIEVESIRVVVSEAPKKSREVVNNSGDGTVDPAFTKPIWFDGKEHPTPVYMRRDLGQKSEVKGPALILDPYSTIVLEPNWELSITNQGDIKLEKIATDNTIDTIDSEVINLELFTNRFSSIAEEMGQMLQRTASSVNVKDRLDFSCALLNPKGELVVNAPHIPVHLGALGLCVRKVNEELEMSPGDVVITNHPAFGGSHLPDVTLITPGYTDDDQLIGYAASRAHHAEIGGITPGSMPPTATSLEEEGVVIPPMYVIKKGQEQWQAITNHLQSAKYPTRNVDENIADIQAAVAANQRGLEGMRKLCDTHGFEKVNHYMNALYDYAESKMKETISTISSGTYESEELLDDGTPLKATLSVDDEQITIDFSGTGSVHPHNLNATPAIVNSVVMYVLRLLIDEPIPLNEGILAPIKMILPSCLLNPEFDSDPAKCPAVVGGNIEVSQRLVDTLLKPFERVACSQGTMNNVLFGNDDFGYYETVGGGTGAGNGFHGADAVHHHMTNTRATDPEILEHRYPVRLDQYAIRLDSGGNGRWRGGHGIQREMTFLEPVELTVLMQHRTEGPYGLQGGQSGQPGEQWIIHKDGTREQLSSTGGRTLAKGDKFVLLTPGGGGFGNQE